MKLEQQVCSIEQAKRLKELGVNQESLFYYNTYWIDKHNPEKPEIQYEPSGKKIISETFTNLQFTSAFTVAELGEMLPWDIVIARNIDKQWHITFQAHGRTEKEMHVVASQDLEADARAKMLIYLLESKLIEL